MTEEEGKKHFLLITQHSFPPPSPPLSVQLLILVSTNYTSLMKNETTLLHLLLKGKILVVLFKNYVFMIYFNKYILIL